MPTREPTEDGPRVVESETEAKQGVEVHKMRYVLAIGTIGAFVVLIVAALVFIV